jgi:hypothetical protein
MCSSKTPTVQLSKVTICQTYPNCMYDFAVHLKFTPGKQSLIFLRRKVPGQTGARTRDLRQHRLALNTNALTPTNTSNFDQIFKDDGIIDRHEVLFFLRIGNPTLEKTLRNTGIPVNTGQLAPLMYTCRSSITYSPSVSRS